MKRVWLFAIGGAVALLPALATLSKSVTTSAKPTPALVVKSAPAAAAPTPAPASLVKDTPMAERIATIGLLNKRNGLWRDLTMKPGEAVRIGDIIIRLKACETTAPWEVEQLTGAFVQLAIYGRDDKWRRVFSGWLFKESPSLNVVENPVYDVWTKACVMSHASSGPDTVIMRGAGPATPARTRAIPPARKPSARSTAPASSSEPFNNEPASLPEDIIDDSEPL
jgi:hypothetical protein